MVGKKKRKAAETAVAMEEEAFPRGGGQGLAPVVQRQLEREAYAEAEAELFGGGAKKGKKRKSAGAEEQADDEDAFFSSMNIHGKLPKYAELLKFKSLSVGTKLWGAVVEVAPHALTVSLPHGLKGHVSYTQASDYLAELAKKQRQEAAAKGDAEEGAGGGGKGGKRAGRERKVEGPLLTQLFTIGQLVRCSVAALEGGGEGGKKKKKVQLSLHVGRVNEGVGVEGLKEGAALPACVRSVEDHGYLLTFGIKGTSGFLPKKAAPGPLAAGSLVEVVVEKVRPGGAAVVTAVQETVAGAVAREWEGLTIGSLMPGALVTARVRNVLSDGLLVSFLTFFSGTIDPFHLGAEPGSDWKKLYSANQRVKARVLYVDPASKRVGLSLAKHLLSFSLPANFPLLGQVFEEATVRRVDPGLGLLCELPAGPGGATLTPGYAHISAAADEKVEELEKRFRPGQRVRCRVTGFRPVDGLAVLSLKPSVVEQNIVSYGDVRAGQALTGKVSKVEDFGLVVAITPSVRAVVPTLHMSDSGTKKAHKKFKEGQKVAGRVLAVDPAARRLTMTLKPALLGSKLPPITCLQDAVPGGRSHGMVTGVQDFGVFVSFYGGTTGLAHVSECGLAPGQKPPGAFEVGQVVKCRVLAHDPAHKGLKLSLVSKKQAAAAAAAERAEGGQAEPGSAPAEAEAAAPAAKKPAAAAEGEEGGDALGGVHAGDLVAATVKTLHSKEVDGETVPSYVEVEVALPEGPSGRSARGKLDAAHLADHPAAAAALWGALRPGTRLEGLLVLQRLEGSKTLQLSRKAALLAAAATLPRTLADVAEGAVLPGYVASVTGDAVFVRFLNGLTGRAGLAALSDTFVSDPHLYYAVGQSVRAQVVQVDREKGRFSLTLKQSICGAPDAAYLASLFRDLEAAAELGAEAGEEHSWAAEFAIGSTVRGEVHDVKEYGVLCDMQGHPDVVGLAAPHQAPEGAAAAPGQSVDAVVLDLNKKDGIVDLSLLPDLLELSRQAAAAGGQAQQQQHKKKKRKTDKGAAAAAVAAEMEQGQEVECTVQLAKSDEGYCVVSVRVGAGAPATPFGFLPTTDYNLARGPQQQHQLAPGDQVRARVAALPSAATCGRLLLHVPLDPRRLKAAAGGRAERQQQQQEKSGGGQGERPQARAGEVVEATVDAVHAMHADLTLAGGGRGRLHICEAAPPLSALDPGSKLRVVVLGRLSSAEGRRHGVAEVCSLPSALEAAQQGQALPKRLGWGSLKAGQQLEGYVQEVVGDRVWCVFSPTVRGCAFVSNALPDPLRKGADLAQQFKAGQALKAHVMSVDNGRRALEVSLVGPRRLPQSGDTVVGRVLAAESSGVRLQLSARSVGKAALTDLHDCWVENALEGWAVRAGQLVRCRVLGKGDEKGHLALSLRPAAVAGGPAPAGDAPPESLSAEELQPGQQLSGYVKAVGPAGAFVCLARGCEARVRLGQLADSFVPNPEEAFPPGKRVAGRVLRVDSGRVELSLKSKGRPGAALEGLEEGAVVRGRVKRVEKFGVFVELEGGATGLAHVSELADEYVKDVGSLFSAGQRVAARVLKVDRAAGRLSLGLKPSYFADLSDQEAGIDGEGGEADFDADLEAAMEAEGPGSEDEEGGLQLAGDSDSDEEELELGGGSSGDSEDEEEGAAGMEVDEAGAASDGEGEPFDLDEELAAAGGSDEDEEERSSSGGEGEGLADTDEEE